MSINKYSELPTASSNTGVMLLVDNTEVVSGQTFYKGYYRSNGVAWVFATAQTDKLNFDLNSLKETVQSNTTALTGKANTTHSHSIANITDLQTVLNTKAPTEHSHAMNEIFGLQDALTPVAKTITYPTSSERALIQHINSQQQRLQKSGTVCQSQLL